MKTNQPTRGISLVIDKNERKLLEQACLYGADAEDNLAKAVARKGKYRVEFSYEELDDLAGFIAACANDEKSERKQEKWDRLSDKIERLLDHVDIKF